MKKTLAAAAFALAATVATAAIAQNAPADGANVAAMLAQAKTPEGKKQLVASSLALTDAEAKKFWPVYDAYQRKLEANNRRYSLAVEDAVMTSKPISDAYAKALDNLRRERNVALEEYAMRDKPMTNRYAKDLTNELLKLEELEIKDRRKMHNAAMRALPPKKAAQYLQIENKLRVSQAYDIAVAFPLEK